LTVQYTVHWDRSLSMDR